MRIDGDGGGMGGLVRQVIFNIGWILSIGFLGAVNNVYFDGVSMLWKGGAGVVFWVGVMLGIKGGGNIRDA